MDCVVMPTCKRIEMLALTLQALERHGRGRELDVRIFADTDANVEDVEFVRDEYYPDATIFHAQAHVDVPSGMWNILNSLKEGYRTGAGRVFLIEEDVVIGKDFFNWHDEAQKKPVLASLGRRHRGWYEFYTNPGSCFSRESLGRVVQHINDDLFRDRITYMNNFFGRMDEVSTLDDGLVRRIQKFYKLPVAIPEKPMCAHIGFMAYNRYMGWVNDGKTIQEKIVKLRQMLLKVELEKSRYTQDFEPIL